jgi:hypothetical protein
MKMNWMNLLDLDSVSDIIGFMDENSSFCPICGNHAASSTLDGNNYIIKCGQCGEYRIGRIAIQFLENNRIEDLRQMMNLSFWLNSNPGSIINASNLERLRSLPTIPFYERAEVFLVFCGRRFPVPGTTINVEEPGKGCNIREWERGNISRKRLQGVTGAVGHEELSFIINDFLDIEKTYLSCAGAALPRLRIRSHGWSRIEEITSGNIESNLGFVAMDFDNQWDDLYKEIIDPGIREAGYIAKKVNDHEHNEYIPDEIISLIRQSKFMIADFSSGNQGVYYEAGFARGLGRTVICLCRKDCLKNIHFDTNQINHILWEEGKWDEAKKAIRSRIEATIGRGPLKPKE